MATFTYFDQAASVTDNTDGGAVTSISITPPTSMTSGDLVVVYTTIKSSSAASAITRSNDGGQTWNDLSEIANGTTSYSRAFWCIYDGTWDANPAFDIDTAATTITGRMLVFRPDSGATVAVDVAETGASHTGSTTVTVPEINSLTDGAVVIALVDSQDDNTYTGPTAPWTTPTPSQIRNLAGSDMSMSAAYQIMATAGASGDAVFTQAINGPDAGTYRIMAFKATGAASGNTPRAMHSYRQRRAS